VAPTVRVLHLHSGNLFGGVETILRELLLSRHLAPEMDSRFALCFEGELGRQLAEAGAVVHYVGPVRLSRPFSVRRARLRLGRLLESELFDACVCHSTWTLAALAPAVRARRLPLVYWVHGVVSARHWLDRWATQAPPDFLIGNSRFSAAAATVLFPGVSCRVLYCPRKPLEAPADPVVARRATRARCRTSEDAVVILQISRMEPLKGQEVHLEALAQLRDDPTWVCWQVGGPQRPSEVRRFEALGQLARRLGIEKRVRFLGERRDVANLLAAADVYCQPNVGPESFGVTFVEALDAGVPVVTSDIGGAAEIVDASCGILTAPGDVDAVAAALRALVGAPELRARLGAAGPGRARSLCDPATALPGLAAVLSDAIAPPALAVSDGRSARHA
jgi:glycosyltransferase involved in cell wall biosynthesis